MKTGVVTQFRDEHSFLSNFFMAPFIWRRIEWPSGEHAFSAAKHLALVDPYIHDMQAHTDKVLAAKTPGLAKKVGRSAKIDVKQWDSIKVGLMREIVHARFKDNVSDYDMVGKLINTGAMMLVEGNDWGDDFWGRCKNKEGKMVGFNTLGTLLMEERGYWIYDRS